MKVRHLWESVQLSVCQSTPPLVSSTNVVLGPMDAKACSSRVIG